MAVLGYLTHEQLGQVVEYLADKLNESGAALFTGGFTLNGQEYVLGFEPHDGAPEPYEGVQGPSYTLRALYDWITSCSCSLESYRK